jgi:hypothetical protein
MAHAPLVNYPSTLGRRATQTEPTTMVHMAPTNQISVLRPLALALPATLSTVIIHAVVLRFIISRVHQYLTIGPAGVRFWRDSVLVSVITLLALTAHLAEIGVWALAFDLCGEFRNFPAAFYHSAVNYTTLGYGDVVMSARWRMLGPLEAADGMLMFGVSTAMIFAVVQRLIQTRYAPSDSASDSTRASRIR